MKLIKKYKYWRIFFSRDCNFASGEILFWKKSGGYFRTASGVTSESSLSNIDIIISNNSGVLLILQFPLYSAPRKQREECYSLAAVVLMQGGRDATIRDYRQAGMWLEGKRKRPTTDGTRAHSCKGRYIHTYKRKNNKRTGNANFRTFTFIVHSFRFFGGAIFSSTLRTLFSCIIL